jgi:peptide/nickel transport system substrate-binding protein
MKTLLVVLAALLCFGVAVAQDEPTTLITVIGNDIENFNTVTQSLATSSTAQSFVFPSLVDTDIDTGLPTDTGLTTWTISEDGLTYTFTIRDDANWSDGTPISANDVKFTFDAIARPEVETIRKSFIESISAINVIDEKTFEVVLTDANCNIWGDLSTLIMPAHKFAADFSDFTSSEFNNAPDISGGPYIVDEWAPDEFVRYTANPTYFKGEPQIDTLVLQVMPDPAVVAQALIAGEVDYSGVSADALAQVEGAPNLSLLTTKVNYVQFLAVNLADPDNPSSAYDEEGNLLEQAPNPFFSDVRVRQAIAMGWDKDAAIELKPEGTSRMVGSIPPSITWAYNNEIEPYAYDPEGAAALLDEAGWVLNDAGIREKDGVPFEFELGYIAGNNNSDELAVLIQDQLGQLGITVNLLSMEAGAMISEKAYPQTFDAIILGATWDTPEPQVLTDLFLNSHQDAVNAGFNFPSYVNPQMDTLLAQAGSNVDCSAEVRAPLYYEIQQIIHDDVPYDFISDATAYHAFSNRVQGVVAGNWGLNGIENWSIGE